MKKRLNLLLIPMSFSVSAKRTTLNLPSGPCTCIVDQKVEKICVKDAAELDRIEKEFRESSAKCPPNAGCGPGHPVEYRVCPINRKK